MRRAAIPQVHKAKPGLGSGSYQSGTGLAATNLLKSTSKGRSALYQLSPNLFATDLMDMFYDPRVVPPVGMWESHLLTPTRCLHISLRDGHGHSIRQTNQQRVLVSDCRELINQGRDQPNWSQTYICNCNQLRMLRSKKSLP